ncbi:MAG: hypothetical protein KAR42_15700 [candidate division Zixibacteria bacterium]|nr:hypothetical protein [candidate division Zixibacteria bacterium]
MAKRIMIQCATKVNRDAIRRESIDGVEHIVISSFTLPDDIVMNGGLYPANEIASSFHTLERTLAPVEHPQDADGNFISASDPEAIHNFHAGAFNTNVSQENGRIKIEKFVNVQEALKTERGKRLLDRIDEIETNSEPRPIHTSVGVFLEPEFLGEVKTNDAGLKYDWIARNMVFDHDAILLDSVGAAQPSQGVGMGVNADGKECEVQRFEINQDVEADPIPDEDEMSHEEIRDALFDAINNPPINGDWIVRVFDSEFIFESDNQLFSAPYMLEGKVAKIVGIPLPVERDETFTPKTNSKGDAMKDMIINALKAANIETDGLDDDELFEAYNNLQANSDSDDDTGEGDVAAVVANAVAGAIAPLTEKIEGLEGKLNAQDDAELDRLAGIVANSGKYPAIDEEAAKKLGVDTLKEMAANCGESFGISLNHQAGGKDEKFSAPSDMPE